MSTATVTHALRCIEAQLGSKQRRVTVRRLTEALCTTFRIPEGSDLVLLLQRDPRVRSNRDAVAAWIEAQLEDPATAQGEHVLPTLIDLFGRKLRSIYETGESA